MPRPRVEVYEVLREAIASGSLRPNEPLREERVAEALGVSRTPVREALIRLLAEGLIEADGAGGARVPDVTGEDYEEVLTLRAALEPLALRYAVRHPDPACIAKLRQIHRASRAALAQDDVEQLLELNTQFHGALNDMGVPRRLRAFIEQLWAMSQRFRFLALYDQDERRQSVEEHGQLIELVEQGDAARAGAVLTRHLERSRDRMAAFLGPAHADGIGELLARRLIGNGAERSRPSP
jgi:DNA-binding GntR family transcriptional regulator